MAADQPGQAGDDLPDGYELAVQKDGSVMIRLPLRLSKRSNCIEFVYEPLNRLLARRASALPRFQACTVVFYHCYAASHQPADVRDHDNLETRAVLQQVLCCLRTTALSCSQITGQQLCAHTGCVSEAVPGGVSGSCQGAGTQELFRHRCWV